MAEDNIDQWRARISKAVAFVEGVDDDEASVYMTIDGHGVHAYAIAKDCPTLGVGHGPTKAEALVALEKELRQVWAARRYVLDGGLRILGDGTETSNG